MAERQYFTVKILKKNWLTDNILELTLVKPAGYIFAAGQYAQFKIPMPNGPSATLETGFVLRSYSFASLPGDNFLMFGIKTVSGGKAGEYLKQIKEGQTVDISLSLGRFNCAPGHLNNKIFVATSCGLAPFISMMEIVLQNGSRVNLLFGVRHNSDIFWQDRLESLKIKYSNFNYFITLSKPSDLWQGLKGRVTDNLGEVVTGEPAEFYLCGNAAMVKDVKALLSAKNIASEKIHFEIF